MSISHFCQNVTYRRLVLGHPCSTYRHLAPRHPFGTYCCLAQRQRADRSKEVDDFKVLSLLDFVWIADVPYNWCVMTVDTTCIWKQIKYRGMHSKYLTIIHQLCISYLTIAYTCLTIASYVLYPIQFSMISAIIESVLKFCVTYWCGLAYMTVIPKHRLTITVMIWFKSQVAHVWSSS